MDIKPSSAQMAALRSIAMGEQPDKRVSVSTAVGVALVELSRLQAMEARAIEARGGHAALADDEDEQAALECGYILAARYVLTGTELVIPT